MEMSAPAARNPIDENRHGLIGKPIDRVEGRLKVMGRATYSHEVQEGGPAACGFIVEATIARGTVAEIDTAAAQKAPGVLLVLTHKNAPKQAAWGPLDAADRYARASPQLGSNRVEHYGQAVAFVVAQTFEQARSASRLITIKYESQAGDYDLAANLAAATRPADQADQKTDSAVGDFESAFAAGAVKIDATFTTPCHVHAQMEPHATLAYWKDGRVHSTAQRSCWKARRTRSPTRCRSHPTRCASSVATSAAASAASCRSTVI